MSEKAKTSNVEEKEEVKQPKKEMKEDVKVIETKAVEPEVVVSSNVNAQSSNSDQSDNLAIASLVVGILSLCSSWFWCCGIPFSIIAIVLGVLGRKSKEKSNLATIGIVLGVIALVLAICFIVLSFMGQGFNYNYNYDYSF